MLRADEWRALNSLGLRSRSVEARFHGGVRESPVRARIRARECWQDRRFEDGTLVLQILHIDDLIVAQCDNASKVEKTFQAHGPSPLRQGPLCDRQGRTPGMKGSERFCARNFNAQKLAALRLAP